MKTLLLRLSSLDSDAEAAVRVITAFDALVEHRASTAALVRVAAGLAECTAGICLPTGMQIRIRSDGTFAPAKDPVVESDAVDLGGGARIWLERPGQPASLDEVILERFAITARLLVEPRGHESSVSSTDPGLIELVLGQRESVEDRARALRLLGFQAAEAIRAVAMTSRNTAVTAALSASPLDGRTVRAAVIDGVVGTLLPAALCPSELTEKVQAVLRRKGLDIDDLTIGVGTPVDGLQARTSWLQARTALRFADVEAPCSPQLIDYSSLGPLALLAEVPTERLRADPDVVALRSLAETASGAAELATLAVYCCTGSLRATARAMHLHHSSVSARLAHIEQALNLDLRQPESFIRARLALTAHQLAR